VAILILWMLGANVAERPVDVFHQLGSHELASASPYMQSAYRDRKGTGRRVVGTIDPRWTALEPEERVEVARAMAQRLRLRAVQELMVYDDRRLLQIHYAGGELRIPHLD
jgi:hypothetical protein